jgi:hypothetical protein
MPASAASWTCAATGHQSRDGLAVAGHNYLLARRFDMVDDLGQMCLHLTEGIGVLQMTPRPVTKLALAPDLLPVSS